MHESGGNRRCSLRVGSIRFCKSILRRRRRRWQWQQRLMTQPNERNHQK